MAIINDDNNPDQQNQPQPGQEPTAGTSAPSGSGSGVAGQNQMMPGKSNVENNAQNQAGYTDVGAYLNANQAGSEKMGQDVATNLTNRYNQTKSGIDTSAQDLQKQVTAGYTPENTDLIKQVAANPTAAAGNQDQLSAFQSQLNDVYGGPLGWGDFGTQQGKVNEAQQYGSLSKTPGGMNVYAQELEGPQASQGVNQLDTMLLQGNTGAMQKIQGAANPFNTLNNYLNTQNTAANTAIRGGQTAAQNASQGALNAFTGTNGTLTNLNTNINQTAAQKLAAAQAQNERLKSGVTNKNLSPEDLAQLGITQEQWSTLGNELQTAANPQYVGNHNYGAATPTQNIDISQWLTQQDPSQAITAGTTATPEQYQQMAAIQQLLGGKTPQGSAINPALASLAGTAPMNLNQFNYQDLLQQLQGYNTGNMTNAQAEAAAGASALDAQHNASKQHGWSGALNRLAPNVLKYAANPLSVVPNEIKEGQKLAGK